MPVDPAALRSEIDADPAALGYAPRVAAGDDAGVALLLNDRRSTLRRPIPLLTLLQWTASSGVRAGIENFANAQKALAPSAQSPVYALCLAMQDSFWGAFGAGHVFDVTDPAIAGPGGMLDAYVAAGIMTADQESACLALGDGPASRAEVLWGDGTVVAHLDVAHALRGNP